MGCTRYQVCVRDYLWVQKHAEELDTRVWASDCTADTLGRRLGSADDNGIGGSATDISPPRWSEQYEHRRAPVQWGIGYVWGVDGNPSDTPAVIPWRLVGGMECRAEDVGLEYLEPLCYSAQPNWLTELGMKEI
jgi:hypothetical protein